MLIPYRLYIDLLKSNTFFEPSLDSIENDMFASIGTPSYYHTAYNGYHGIYNDLVEENRNYLKFIIRHRK